MLKSVIAVAALLCLVPASVLAQPELQGFLEHSDNKQRIIQVDGVTYKMAHDVKVTADGGRTIDLFLLRPGQPLGLFWRKEDSSRTITRIHVYDQFPL